MSFSCFFRSTLNSDKIFFFRKISAVGEVFDLSQFYLFHFFSGMFATKTLEILLLIPELNQLWRYSDFKRVYTNWWVQSPRNYQKTVGSVIISGGIEVNWLPWICLILEAKIGDDPLASPTNLREFICSSVRVSCFPTKIHPCLQWDFYLHNGISNSFKHQLASTFHEFKLFAIYLS